MGWKLYSKAVCPERVLFDRNIPGNLRHFQRAEVEDRELTYIWCFLFSLLLEFTCRENPLRAWVMSLASKVGRGAFLILPSTCTVGAEPRNQVQISGLVYCNVWHALSECVKTVTHMKSLYHCMALSNSVKGPLVTYWWNKCVCAF